MSRPHLSERLVRVMTLLIAFSAVFALSLRQPQAASLTAVLTAPRADPLPDRGLAPELTNTIWLNSAAPLRLADLRGQVVLLDFWTVNCFNCEHTIPYVRDLYARLNGKGVQVISVHFPEFGYEREPQTVSDYARQWQVRYPIAIDNDGATWNAYEMHAWPAFELIDKNGHRRYRLIGEGGDKALEAAIQSLLAEPYSAPVTATPFSYF